MSVAKSIRQLDQEAPSFRYLTYGQPSYGAGRLLNSHQSQTLVSSGSVVPSGTNNVNGTAYVITPDAGPVPVTPGSVPAFDELIPLDIGVTIAAIGSETVSCKLTATRSDGSTATITKTTTTDQYVSLMGAGDYAKTLAKAGTYITQLSVALSSTINNSSSTGAVVAVCIEKGHYLGQMA